MGLSEVLDTISYQHKSSCRGWLSTEMWRELTQYLLRMNVYLFCIFTQNFARSFQHFFSLMHYPSLDQNIS